MSSVVCDPRFAALQERLGEYCAHTLDLGIALARRLHAEELSPEHILAAMLGDEDCGATRLVLYAFADPETLGIEVMALCDGIMVVRSSGSLPFSVQAVEALEGAHREAARRGSETVAPIDLLCSAWRTLSVEVRGRLQTLEPTAGPAPGGEGRNPDRHLFAAFDETARRALGRAARAASEHRRNSISPAHLILGALEADESLTAATQLTPQAARFALADADDDPTPLPDRPLSVAEELFELLAPLPDGAGTSALLGRFLGAGSEEVRALLIRQKITPALYERAGGSFSDPDPPPTGS